MELDSLKSLEHTAKKAAKFLDYPFSSHYFQLDSGHCLHYLDEGRPGREVIVLLHGNPTWSYFYRKLIPVLARTHRVIAVDHLGCGLSDKPQDEELYTLQKHGENVEALVQFLGIEKFSLVMHDWGGAIGMGLAVKRPESISRLVLMNTAAFCSVDIPKRIFIGKIPRLGRWMIRRGNLFVRAALVMAPMKKLSAGVKLALAAPYQSYADRVAIHRFVQDIPLSKRHPSYQTLAAIEKKLPTFINTPVLLVWGGKDFCFHSGFLQQWQKIYPHAKTVVYENAGHYVMEDASPEIEGVIDEFFQSKRSLQ
jgi:pimeloyl-ACP methyl ester carboxylesterase